MTPSEKQLCALFVTELLGGTLIRFVGVKVVVFSTMDICRDLEQQYGLIPADQKQKSQSSLLSLKPVNYKNGDIKYQIANVIRPIAKDYHFQSLKEYRALLTLYNIGVEEVKGEINGKEYKGLIYSALNDKGEKAGNPFKSSLFGKSVGIEALEKRMEQSAEIIKNKHLKERSKKVISAAMLTSKNRADFEDVLAKQGISVLFRENEQGRIYGATFIDHEQKCVFNGSCLGKEFSANVFNDLFNGTGNKFDKEQTFVPFEKSFEKNEGSGIGGIFDLFTPESSASDEIEEQNFIRLEKTATLTPTKRIKVPPKSSVTKRAQSCFSEGVKKVEAISD